VRQRPVLRTAEQVNTKEAGYDGIDTIRARVAGLRDRLANWFRDKHGELQKFLETSRSATERRLGELAERNRETTDRIRAETATHRGDVERSASEFQKALGDYDQQRERSGGERSQLAGECRKIDQSADKINTYKSAIEAHREAEAVKDREVQAEAEKPAEKQSERDYDGLSL